MATHYRYSFHVMGTNTNKPPLDMMRYDQCWPWMQEDVSAISSLPQRNGRGNAAKAVSFWMRSAHPPTVERWASFGWSIIEVKKEKVQ
jgi:hypothetical protein